jgi:membrane protein DedA with SNARE-associated domain
MTTVTATALKIVALVGTGMCFAVGFWAGRRFITNPIDERLVLRDKKMMKEIINSL